MDTQEHKKCHLPYHNTRGHKDHTAGVKGMSYVSRQKDEYVTEV